MLTREKWRGSVMQLAAKITKSKKHKKIIVFIYLSNSMLYNAEFYHLDLN